MWIRSQNKKRLSDCVEFYIQEKLQYRYAVIGCSKNSCGHIIGEYSTKEKALEVLDMIQKHLTGFLVSGCSRIVHDCPIAGIEFHCVFEMPQDEDVK